MPVPIMVDPVAPVFITTPSAGGGARGPASVQKKFNLAYPDNNIVFRCAGYDTVGASITHVGPGDLVASTLSFDVSNDGINWIRGLFTTNDFSTAAGTQTSSSGIVNIQGWPWCSLRVSAAAGSDKWVVGTVYGKINTTGT